MPELPEVEEVRRSLLPHLRGARAIDARVLRRDFVLPEGVGLGTLRGRALVRTHRHGKKLFLVADDGQTLVVHLGMSGRVDCVPAKVPVAVHTHVILTLSSGTDVRFRDPRRFGGIIYYATFEEAQRAETAALGHDALVLTAAHLVHWKRTRGRLKQRLLSQRDVAGLGNIYVDEALWAARLHPLQRVDRLKPEQVELLVREIRAVLERSIKSGGTTLRDYRNVADQPGAFAQKLRAYGRGGEACFRCGGVMKLATIATRTTAFCAACQRRR